MKQNSFLRKNKYFLIPVLITISIGIVFLSLFSKEIIHLQMNTWHSPFGDTIFPLITHLGDGLIFLPVSLLLVFVKWRYVAGLFFVAVLTGVLVGFLKNVVFQGEPRPAKYFEDKTELHLVEGLKMNQVNSFPSGHTTAAFSCWGFLAFLVVRVRLKFLFFSIALVASFSRIYLSQHFLQDVMAGIILGVSIAYLSYFLMNKINTSWIEKKLTLNR